MVKAHATYELTVTMKPVTWYDGYTSIKMMEIKLSALERFVCSHAISFVFIFLLFESLWTLGFFLKGRRG